MSNLSLPFNPKLIWPDVFRLQNDEAFPEDYSRVQALADAFSYRGLRLESAPPSWVNHEVLTRIEDGLEITGSDSSWEWASENFHDAWNEGGERAEWWRAPIGPQIPSSIESERSAIAALDRLADDYEESGKQLSQAVGAIADKLAEINSGETNHNQ